MSSSTSSQPTTAFGLPDPVLRKVQRGSSHALAALILVQAFLAGRSLFGTWSITVHGIVGNVVFMISLVLLVAALMRRADRMTIGLAVLLVVLITTQIGLGYSGRESLEAAAWHVPNGVLSFGVAVYLATRPSPPSS